MLRFFRQIRKDQLMSDKARKYFLYAVGEIALVVIGILLALQINIWNENRKLKAEEINILRALKTDLSAGLEAGAQYLSEDSTQLKILNTYLVEPDWKEQLSYSEDIDSLITNAIFTMMTEVPVIQVREDLNSSGKNTLISNQDIRNKLVELDSNTKLLQYQIDDKMNVQQRQVDRMLIDYFNLRKMVKSSMSKPHEEDWKPDLEAILENREASNVIAIKVAISGYVLGNRRDLQNTIRELITMIDQELNS